MLELIGFLDSAIGVTGNFQSTRFCISNKRLCSFVRALDQASHLCLRIGVRRLCIEFQRVRGRHSLGSNLVGLRPGGGTHCIGIFRCLGQYAAPFFTQDCGCRHRVSNASKWTQAEQFAVQCLDLLLKALRRCIGRSLGLIRCFFCSSGIRDPSLMDDDECNDGEHQQNPAHSLPRGNSSTELSQSIRLRPVLHRNMRWFARLQSPPAHSIC